MHESHAFQTTPHQDPGHSGGHHLPQRGLDGPGLRHRGQALLGNLDAARPSRSPSSVPLCFSAGRLVHFFKGLLVFCLSLRFLFFVLCVLFVCPSLGLFSLPFLISVVLLFLSVFFPLRVPRLFFFATVIAGDSSAHMPGVGGYAAGVLGCSCFGSQTTNPRRQFRIRSLHNSHTHTTSSILVCMFRIV